MNQFSSDLPWLPCRLFGEHGGICKPRVDFKDSTASLKSCPSEYVKKNLVWRFSVIYGKENHLEIGSSSGTIITITYYSIEIAFL